MKKYLINIIITSTLAFSWIISASAATTYTLKSPVPGVVNAGTVSEGVSTSGDRNMWKDASGQLHLLATFGGDVQSGWYASYINLNTGENAFITGAKEGSGGGFAYSPTFNRLYGATGYTNRNNTSFVEFDPVTKTLNILADRNLPMAVASSVIGDDNRVYQYLQGGSLFSYDPAVGMPDGWKDYGIALDNTNIYRALGIDTEYVYLGLKKPEGTWTLMISPIAGNPSWQEWEFGNSGDTALSISIAEPVGSHSDPHKWMLTRTLSDSSKKFFHLHDGTYTEFFPGDPGYIWNYDTQHLPTIPNGEYHGGMAPRYLVAASDENSYPLFASTYNYEVDMTDFFPIKGIHEFTAIKYRSTGSPTWLESNLSFTGPWLPQVTTTVQPLSDNNIFGATYGYNAVFNLDYKAPATTYLGPSLFSPYESLKHSSGEIYIGGYADKVFRYDPAKPWTLATTNNSEHLPTDSNKPNPYFIQMPGDTYHYRHWLDYDVNGIVWIGGNTTRGTTANPDYGNVMWYDPANGDTGYMFPGWKSMTSSVMFRNLAAAANRSKIVVSANNGFLYVINAATKTIDGTYNLGEYAYMADVDGKVVGVTPGGNIFKFNPITRSMIVAPKSIGVSGTPFGFGNNRYSRMNYKLEKGPDNFLWMFVGDTLYRINPDTLVFNKVMDTTYAKLKFAANNTDLLLYGNGTDFKYIPGILEPSQTFHASDLNEDDSVNATDFNIFKLDFQKLAASLTNPKSDIDGDGQATVKDVGIMMSNWR